MSNTTHVITVDAAGTLIRPWPSVGAVYGKTARGFGLSVKDKEVDERFYEVFGKVQKDRKITSGGEKDFWRQVVLAVFEPYAGLSLIPFSNPTELRRIRFAASSWKKKKHHTFTISSL